MGLRVSDIKPGTSVVVIGAGPIGQMMLRWAATAGADPVMVVDMVTLRLQLARGGGATHTFAKPPLEFGRFDPIVALQQRAEVLDNIVLREYGFARALIGSLLGQLEPSGLEPVKASFCVVTPADSFLVSLNVPLRLQQRFLPRPVKCEFLPGLPHPVLLRIGQTVGQGCRPIRFRGGLRVRRRLW